MKNLNICDVSCNRLNFLINSQHNICYGYNDKGSINGEIFSCTNNLILTNYSQNGDIKWKKDLSKVVSPNNSVVNVTLLSFRNAVCVGLSNGEIIAVSDDGVSHELAGVCESGLQAMEWSTDEDSVVLVTRDQKMILMSCTFDPIQEVILTDNEFGEGKFMTVGWGKKETQFHGSEGKQAAKAKLEINSDPNTINSRAKITWRGDGELYAVGFTMEGIRRFKVFDREGNLHYTSEKQPGLENNISWRPSGNVIATTQRLQNTYMVAFFEKNGLKHGGFDLPVNETTKVEDISWCLNSEIIALQCLDSSDETRKILLFTTSNYHWSLKQSIVFKSNQQIIKMFWDNNADTDNNNKLHVVLENGLHHVYTWIWDVNHSIGRDDSDDAVVAVIDGNKVLLTGFRQTVVPPPMAALDLTISINVNEVSFLQNKGKEGLFDTNSFVVVTEDMKLCFYKQKCKFPLQYELIFSGIIEAGENPFANYNWQWISEDTIVSVQYLDETYNLLEYKINIKGSMCEFNLTHSVTLPESVMGCSIHPSDNEKLFVHLNSGEIVEYAIGGDLNPSDIIFPSACKDFKALHLNNELIFLGLSHRGNFYINDTLVLTNVSSYFVHTHFLLLTTLQHVLLCTELTKAGLDALKDYQKTESPHVYRRKTERCAKLIIAVPNDTRTVFQLPRGNLEAIQPRPLSLKIIGEYLDALKYNEAFDLMRKQRINLNLIYDHNPDTFLKYVDKFLDSIKNNSWLSLFLSELENVDVTKTMYSTSYADQSSKDDSTKIVKVCDIIRAHITQRFDRDTKILPLLTSYVKKNTVEDLENALTIIKELKSQEAAGSKKPVGSDEALKYLLYMVDVNNLFDVALGMYDFDLVLLVASKSQKDPKEYVPMLNELNEMEEYFKRFTVNKYLKRFDRAVECLAKCGPEKYDELKTFVKYHSLYRKALEMFSPNEDIYKQISDDFGLFLKLKKQFVEAGVVYKRAESFDKAIECFKEAVEWELAIDLAHGWPKEQFQELCLYLVHSLQEEKRHTDALKILEQFGDKPEDSIIYAVTNSQYRTALRICSQHNRSDLREKLLLPTILEEYSNLREQISINEETFHRHRNRLLLVRETKSRQPAEVFDDSYANKDSDLYSDAGSTVASSASRSSSRTFRSSKNRRKHERKVASLKEGSRYEDVALVLALHTLVTATSELRLPVREVNVVLISLCRDQEALTLQVALEKLLKAMKESFKEVWSNEFLLEATNAAVAAQNVPEGCSIVPQGIATLDPHLRIAPVIQDVTWKLDGLS